jgi:hypothetical protein
MHWYIFLEEKKICISGHINLNEFNKFILFNYIIIKIDN